MRVEELKNDANFMTIPVGVYDYVSAHKFNQTQYVGWWSNCGNVLRIFAYKWKKMEKLVIREVIRSTPDMDSGLVYRDMYLTGMCGWRVMYERKAAKSQNWYGYVYYDGDLCRLMDINGYDRSFGVRPIVTLKSDVQLEANGENNWKIK